MTRLHQQKKSPQRVATLLLAAALGACAGKPMDSPEIARLENYPDYPAPSADLLHVSPAMKAFIEAHSGEKKPGRSKIWSLTHAVLDPYVLDFKYDPQVTLPADQAFQLRTGNCLTFSSLYIALAREAGLEAWYQEIQIPANWTSVEDTLLVGMHVNAVARDRGRKYTVDISRLEHDENHLAKRISDSEAAAQYYNNLGADALIENELGMAYAYFRKALNTQSGLAYVWSNLGVVYRRNGQTPDAIAAYRHALRLDPLQTVALNNLYLIYEEDGDLESAAEIQKKAESNRRNNPYYLNHLAETAIEEQRYADAVEFSNRAIRMDEEEYRFHYTLSQAWYFSGDIDAARASLARARELAPENLAEGPLALPDQDNPGIPPG